MMSLAETVNVAGLIFAYAGSLVLEIRRQYRGCPSAAAGLDVIQMSQIQCMRQEVIEQCPRSEGRAIPVFVTTVMVVVCLGTKLRGIWWT